MDLVTNQMQSFLENHRKEGLHALVITDKDGVPLLKVADDEIPEMALCPSFFSNFGMTTDLAGKLGLGQNKSMVYFYTNLQVLIFNRSPLLITMLANVDANTGFLMNVEKQLSPLLGSFAAIVENEKSRAGAADTF